jgi:aquaporin Z
MLAMTRRLAAEFIGTLWLVLGGCGSAVLAAAFANLGIGFSLAFGLTVLTMAYAIGHVSGCHLNPVR